MKITVQEVERIAKLAKLEFTAGEKVTLTHQLGDILNYIDQLNEVDTEHVAPTYNLLELKNVLREDEVEPWLTQEEALKNAPATNSGFFSVPKVIAHEK